MTLDKRSVRVLSSAAWLGLVLHGTAAAQATIFPDPPATGGKHVIAVISDGYTANDAWKFDRAVKGLVLNGMMQDAFYKAHSTSFTIKKFFKPVVQPQQSAFEVKPNYNNQKCYIDWTVNTTGLIEDAVKLVSPEHTIVIGNYEGVSFGCAVDTWTYVSAGAREVGGVLEHEFGHLIAGLLDEYVFDTLKNTRFPDHVDGPNCSNALKPIWSYITNPKPINVEGCDHYGKKIWRPYNTCRMRGDNQQFCYVCEHETGDQLLLFLPDEGDTKAPSRTKARLDTPPVLLAGVGVQQPKQPETRPTEPRQPAQQAPPMRTAVAPPPAPLGPSPDKAIRLLVELHKPQADASSGATATILGISDVTIPIVGRYRRVGDYIYGVYEAGTVLEATVIPGDPFQQRGYAGVSAPHPALDGALTTRLIVLIPHVARAQLPTRNIGVAFYRLDPLSGVRPDGRREYVTRDTIQNLITLNKAKLADIGPDALKTASTKFP